MLLRSILYVLCSPATVRALQSKSPSTPASMTSIVQQPAAAPPSSRSRPSSGSRRASFAGETVMREPEVDWVPAGVRERAAKTFDSAAAADGTIPLEAVPKLLEGLVQGGVLLEDFMHRQNLSAAAAPHRTLSKSEFIGLAAALREHAAEMRDADADISDAMRAKLQAIFNKMDVDGNKRITKKEASDFWNQNFAKINAGAMFNEVDENGDGNVTEDEWFAFWRNVLKHGYNAKEVSEELDVLMEGGSWVDFNDGRNT